MIKKHQVGANWRRSYQDMGIVHFNFQTSKKQEIKNM